MPEEARLAADPANDVCPNFAAVAFAPVRNVMHRENDQTEEDAVTNLIEMWTQEHNTCLERWAIQQAEDAWAAREAEREQQQAHEEENHPPAGQGDDQAQPEADKEKPKLNDFDEDKPIPSILLLRPSQYPLQKLKQGDYIELWYFSSEGYHEAKGDACSTADDALGISRSEDVLTLRPASAVKASKNALLDHELPMLEFLRVKNAFLHHAAQ